MDGEPKVDQSLLDLIEPYAALNTAVWLKQMREVYDIDEPDYNNELRAQ